MLIDYEGNKIKVRFDINPHGKINGGSGYGKTFLTCRIMDSYGGDIPILVIDYSGSFTEDELRKNKLEETSEIHIFNAKESIIKIQCGPTMEYVVDNVVEALVTLDHDMPVTQQDILQECTYEAFRLNGYITFKHVFDLVRTIARDEENESMYRQNAEHLMRRMKELRNLDNIQMVIGEEPFANGICIYQLSAYSKEKRNKLGQLLVELIWNRIRQKKQRVQIVLDEFQNLKLSGTAVEEMLREGRRFGVGVLLISQYPSSGADLDILEQASTSFYLHPNDRRLKETAKMIDPNNYSVWMQKLKTLNVGECIFTGRYEVNGNVVTDFRPLLCKIVTDVS